MTTSKFYTDSPSLPPLGKNAYALSREWGCTPTEAARRAEAEMYCTGYDNYGEMCYISKQEENRLNAKIKRIWG